MVQRTSVIDPFFWIEGGGVRRGGEGGSINIFRLNFFVPQCRKVF